MCLVLVAYGTRPDTPLLVAANRDEYHARPTDPLHWWPDKPDILAGRDLKAGGTWLGISRRGRFACVTNYRAGRAPADTLRSRGELITAFLESPLGPMAFLENLAGSRYAGFNLLLSDGKTLAYGNNVDTEPQELRHGIYGLANADLDAPWHKSLISKAALEQLIVGDRAHGNALFDLLGNRQTAPADAHDDHPQSALSAPFIVLPDYGTRSSTTLTVAADGAVEIRERRYSADGQKQGECAERFRLRSP